MIKFLNKLSSNVVLYLSLFFSIGIVLLNVVGVFSFTKLLSFNSMYEVIVIIIALVAIALLVKILLKIKGNKWFLVTLFLISFLIRLLWIIFIDTMPVSDFKVMYDGASEIAKGNYNFILESYYFNTWVYQLGFTGYLALLMKLFNNSLFMIKFVNVIIVSLIPVVIYFSAKKLTNEKVARVAAILYAMYIGSIANTSVLTNQHLATLLFYIAILLLISNINRTFKWILVGVCIGLGNMIRPEGSIVILAILLFVVFKNITDIKEVGKSLIEFGGILIIVVMVSQLFSFVFINSGISKYPLGNRDPLWKFSCGLNPNSKGTYNDEDLNYLYNAQLSGVSRNEAHMTLIKERLSNQSQLVITMAYKYVNMWALNDTSLQLSFTDNVDKPIIYDMTIKLEKIQYIIIVVLYMIGIFEIIRNKEGFSNNHIYLIIFLGYLLAHLLIEVQPRYRYFALPILFIIASYSLSEKKLKNKF